MFKSLFFSFALLLASSLNSLAISQTTERPALPADINCMENWSQYFENTPDIYSRYYADLRDTSISIPTHNYKALKVYVNTSSISSRATDDIAAWASYQSVNGLVYLNDVKEKKGLVIRTLPAQL